MAPENFADLSLIKQAAARHGNDMRYQLALNMLNHMAISLKIPMENCSNYGNGEMNTADLLALSDIEDFYIRALQRKDWKNTYKINLALGNLYLLRKEYVRSRTYFDSAIKARPATAIDQDNNAADAYDYLIASYLMAGDTANAEKYTRKKLADKAELYPAARNYTELAAYDLKKNKLAAMDSDLRHALALDSACVEAYMGYGILYIRKSEAARSEKYLNIVDKLQPGNANIAVLMAISFLQRDDPATAYTLLKQAKAQDDKNPVIKNLLEYYDAGQ
jgi:lipopolysaccharide biosynthesis regulator YciM